MIEITLMMHESAVIDIMMVLYWDKYMLQRSRRLRGRNDEGRGYREPDSESDRR